jgi:hypothetical protein
VFLFRNTGGRGRDGMMPCLFARRVTNDAAWIDCPPELQETSTGARGAPRDVGERLVDPVD